MFVFCLDNYSQYLNHQNRWTAFMAKAQHSASSCKPRLLVHRYRVAQELEGELSRIHLHLPLCQMCLLRHDPCSKPLFRFSLHSLTWQQCLNNGRQYHKSSKSLYSSHCSDRFSKMFIDCIAVRSSFLPSIFETHQE